MVEARDVQLSITNYSLFAGQQVVDAMANQGWDIDCNLAYDEGEIITFECIFDTTVETAELECFLVALVRAISDCRP